MKPRSIAFSFSCIFVLLLRIEVSKEIPFPSVAEPILDHDDTPVADEEVPQEFVLKSAKNGDVRRVLAKDETFFPTVETDLQLTVNSNVSDSPAPAPVPVPILISPVPTLNPNQLKPTEISSTEMPQKNLTETDIPIPIPSKEFNFIVNKTNFTTTAPVTETESNTNQTSGDISDSENSVPLLENIDISDPNYNHSVSKEQLIPNTQSPHINFTQVVVQNPTVQNSSKNIPSFFSRKPQKSEQPFVPLPDTKTTTSPPQFFFTITNTGNSEKSRGTELATIATTAMSGQVDSDNDSDGPSPSRNTPKFMFSVTKPTQPTESTPTTTSPATGTATTQPSPTLVSPSNEDPGKSEEKLGTAPPTLETTTGPGPTSTLSFPSLTTIPVQNERKSPVENSTWNILTSARKIPRIRPPTTKSPEATEPTFEDEHSSSTSTSTSTSLPTTSVADVAAISPEPRSVMMPMSGFNRPCNSYFDCGFRPVSNGSRTWLRCIGNFCACELLGYIKDDEADWDINWNHQAEACLADLNGPCGFNKGIEIHCNIGYQCLDHVCDKTGRIRVKTEIKTTAPPLTSCDEEYKGLNICEKENRHRLNLYSLLIFPSLNIFESILNNSLNTINSMKQLY